MMLCMALSGLHYGETCLAAEAYPVITDPNDVELMFGGTDLFSFGAYAIDADAALNGNNVLLFAQNFSGPCCHGAGFSVPVSNGENGIDETFDGAENQDLNIDVPNTEPANPAFEAIGNATGKLENGNVLRLSAWFRSDPANPITLDPSVQPVLKFEFWKEALSPNADTNGGQVQPLFGDKVFDQEQHGGTLGIPVVDRVQWIDIDGDGIVIDVAAADDERISTISTDAWTLVEGTYTVNDADWIGIGDDPYTVVDIEEIRAVMFLGDFAGTDLTGDGDGGNLLVDNILVEVFKDAASITRNMNPDPMPAVIVGDLNGDAAVNFGDLSPFVKALTDIPGYETMFPGLDRVARCDTSGDAMCNFGDLSPFVALLTGGPGNSASAVPEPSVVGLALLAALALFERHRTRW
jgi:hypothetical protein